MKYARLGRSGLKVSRLCLGCMSFGDPARGEHGWTLNEEASRPLIRQAVEAGINFFDTANLYSFGSSEEITGKALKDFARRDEIVIATKVYFPWGMGPNLGGLSRKAIFAAIDASLARLGTDYVDLYQIHRFDPETPLEETMEALHDLVKAGKVRYLGASSMHAWQFQKAQHIADSHGWTRFISMQNHLNLIYREEEREMMPLCADMGVGVIPWSPLARGRLARAAGTETTRAGADGFAGILYNKTEETDRAVIEAVARVATDKGTGMAEVALAWLLHKSTVTAPIIGATKPHHLEAAIRALDVKLEPQDVGTLEAPYAPHAIAGFR